VGGGGCFKWKYLFYPIHEYITFVNRIEHKRSSVILHVSSLFLLCTPTPNTLSSPFSPPQSNQDSKECTYAGARVVFRKVLLQVWHWISFACSLILSCDFGVPPASFALARARLDCAFAPYYASLEFVNGWLDKMGCSE
jgi:hypothetical protein